MPVMNVTLDGARVVLLPGTGSDEVYLRRAFGAPLAAAGAELMAVAPRPGRLVEGYLEDLDAAAEHGPIAVGGVSLGAAVAVAWAASRPDAVVGVLAALPAWTGPPGEAPASLSAQHTAAQLRAGGLEAAITAMTATSPDWLSAELSRSWRRQWPLLPQALEEAAAHQGPTLEQLRVLAAPMGIAAASDDALHPMAVAQQWSRAAPRAALRRVALTEFGPQPELLGQACLAALREAGGGPIPVDVPSYPRG